MKYLLSTLMLLSTITSVAFAELTPSDLEKIQKIVEASETRMKEYIDIKFESVDERFKSVDTRFGEVGGKINLLTAILCALIGLVGVVIVIPTWRESKANRSLEKQVEILTQRMDALENGRIQNPGD